MQIFDQVFRLNRIFNERFLRYILDGGQRHVQDQKRADVEIKIGIEFKKSISKGDRRFETKLTGIYQ